MACEAAKRVSSGLVATSWRKRDSNEPGMLPTPLKASCRGQGARASYIKEAVCSHAYTSEVLPTTT